MPVLLLDTLISANDRAFWRLVDDRGRPLQPAAHGASGTLLLEAGALNGALASLELTLPANVWLENEYWLEGKEGDDPVNIYLYLEGECTYLHPQCGEVIFREGKVRIFLEKPPNVRARIKNGNGPFRALGISLGRHALGILHAEGALPPPLAALAEGKSAPGEFVLPLLPVFAHIARELAASISWGPGGRIYREAKVLEFLALLFNHWNARHADQSIPPNPQLRERLDAARDRLLAHMPDPPSIEELAREAGLGLTVFREAFRRRFGMPIYEYLRVRRLEAARNMIADGLSVQLAAHRVGYMSEAAFARAYRRHFGHSPTGG